MRNSFGFAVRAHRKCLLLQGMVRANPIPLSFAVFHSNYHKRENTKKTKEKQELLLLMMKTLCLEKREKAFSMNINRAEFPKGFHMLFCSVSLVTAESVSREFCIDARHEAVPQYLCDDGRRGDDWDAFIPPDECLMRRSFRKRQPSIKS